jgi:hypothetical protein
MTRSIKCCEHKPDEIIPAVWIKAIDVEILWHNGIARHVNFATNVRGIIGQIVDHRMIEKRYEGEEIPMVDNQGTLTGWTAQKIRPIITRKEEEYGVKNPIIRENDSPDEIIKPPK